jgi:signal transduction histidine kinase
MEVNQPVPGRNELLSLIAEHTSDVIGIIDRDGTATVLTPSVKRIFSDLAPLNTPIPMQMWMQLVHADYHEHLESHLALRAPFMIIVRSDHPERETIWLEMYCNPFTDADGAFAGYVFSARDVTIHRHVLIEHERMRVTLNREHDLNELKTRMMMRVNHEFRTPLAKIMTSGDMLERYSDRLSSEKQAEYHREIKRQIGRMTDMLDDIAFVVQGNFGSLRFDPRPFDLRRVCWEIVNSAQQKVGSGQRVELRYSDEGEPVCADEALIRLMLVNLVSNALKYSPEGSRVELLVSVEALVVTMVVRDSGIGISDDDQRHMGEAFFRGTNTGEITGMGLGLSIVRQAVKLHGGSLEIVSRLNEGTTVTLRFSVSDVC